MAVSHEAQARVRQRKRNHRKKERKPKAVDPSTLPTANFHENGEKIKISFLTVKISLINIKKPRNLNQTSQLYTVGSRKVREFYTAAN